MYYIYRTSTYTSDLQTSDGTKVGRYKRQTVQRSDDIKSRSFHYKQVFGRQSTWQDRNYFSLKSNEVFLNSHCFKSSRCIYISKSSSSNTFFSYNIWKSDVVTVQRLYRPTFVPSNVCTVRRVNRPTFLPSDVCTCTHRAVKVINNITVKTF